ncbi:MAG: rubredoxin [Bacteroidales bacterium]|nr:rubredoxin [Bacteroidales bacterium]
MKYKCSICGYVYDDAQHDVAFADLPDSWECPLCGAPKAAFEPIEEASLQEAAAEITTDAANIPTTTAFKEDVDESMQKLSIGQMAALCSNLARGCEKQYMPHEMALFNELAEWFTSHTPKVDDDTVADIAARLKQDIADYPMTNRTCVEQADRGAQRVLAWGEKVTRMLSSLMDRYQREGDALLQEKEIWVCSVCGFVFIGPAAPELCPVCKVPAWKFNKIERRKQS